MSLSRLRVGVDVPWVTSWSEETLDGARPCRSADGRRAVFQAERPGWGRPNYAANHFRRQRESVAWMLCPMCGEPTAADDRWTLTAQRVSAGVLRARGLEHVIPFAAPDNQVILNAGTIAPLHRACADRSAQACPHLTADRTIRLLPFPERWVVTPLMVEAHPVSASHVLAAGPPGPVAIVGFLQLCGLTDDVDASWRASGGRVRARR